MVWLGFVFMRGVMSYVEELWCRDWLCCGFWIIELIMMMMDVININGIIYNEDMSWLVLNDV